MNLCSSKFISTCSSHPHLTKPSNFHQKTYIHTSTISSIKTTISHKNTSSLDLPSIIFNALDDIITRLVDLPLRPSVDPTIVLSDNFAPVPELPPAPCQILTGSIPSCLNGGAYIRNGPNPQFPPRGPYHQFDGDGMLHAVKFTNSAATLCSRYVQTYKYTVEHHVGCPVLPNIFSGFHGPLAIVARGTLAALRVMFGQYDPWRNGIGLANTSLAYLGESLYALGESDLPYTVRVTYDGDIETIGRHDFGGKVSMNMTAHPKIDAETNEIFSFRYSPMRPYLTYFRLDCDGNKQGPDVPVFSMDNPSFIHDFAITKKYAIFVDIQLGINMKNPVAMVVQGKGKWSPVNFDPEKIPKIGVIPRYANDESEMLWFDIPNFNIMHAVNAWDDQEGEDGSIVMVAPNIAPIEHTLDKIHLIHGSMEKIKIDLKTGTVSRKLLSSKNLDFGVINPTYVGKKNKYVYAAIGDPMPKITGIVKLDISKDRNCDDCIVACRMYDHGCYGGEPFFVARDEAEEEDDGYVVTYVHDENSGESRFLVMDAKSQDLEIVAVIKLPRRVPYGFHGLFVKESDLNKL